MEPYVHGPQAARSLASLVFLARWASRARPEAKCPSTRAGDNGLRRVEKTGFQLVFLFGRRVVETAASQHVARIKALFSASAIALFWHRLHRGLQSSRHPARHRLFEALSRLLHCTHKSRKARGAAGVKSDRDDGRGAPTRPPLPHRDANADSCSKNGQRRASDAAPPTVRVVTSARAERIVRLVHDKRRTTR